MAAREKARKGIASVTEALRALGAPLYTAWILGPPSTHNLPASAKIIRPKLHTPQNIMPLPSSLHVIPPWTADAIHAWTLTHLYDKSAPFRTEGKTGDR